MGLANVEMLQIGASHQNLGGEARYRHRRQLRTVDFKEGVPGLLGMEKLYLNQFRKRNRSKQPKNQLGLLRPQD
ncbi:hypothetical protein AURDEDRAFT_116694 [Auricularia subglabra TFB-10046 SS5]|uniref:Uncharacterized protein n=1 Tax=Auricularia subglabra (strain TFB-10046 / SS5) TaxID=717982 RepID=J0WW97_AURST|nr:hypothetical protein AURDEDRAFT_116694 [Auricularia subglabra TFB-10046 SS5]